MRLSFSPFALNQDCLPTLITPNRLFADVLLVQHARERLQAGHRTWQRPTVTTVGSWLSNLWEQKRYNGADVPTLLSPQQERALWRQLFERQHPELFDFGGAARLAVEATQTLAEWRITLEGDGWETTKDASHFRDLCRIFHRECRQRDCITRADLWRLAPDWVVERPVLLGFPAPSPGLQSFSSTCYPFTTDSKKKPRLVATKCQTFTDEVEHCARWARARVEVNSRQSIGILVPKLLERRRDFSRMFAEVFYPAGQTDDHQAFHIHVGRALTEEPVIAFAALCLQLAENDISISDASAILRSPYLKGANAERSLRALADIGLRHRRDLRVTLGQLEYRSANCPMLLKAWRAVRHVLNARPRVASLTEWSEWITDLLNAAGWPGDATLRHDELAAIEAWNDALTQLSELTFVFGPAPFGVARRELEKILQAAAAPEQSDFFSPVQILDAASAGGLRFDEAALCGFSEDAWPPPSKNQPFIPLLLRRQAGMPGTNAGEAAEERIAQTRQLLDVADSMIATSSEPVTPLLRPFLPGKNNSFVMWQGKRASESFELAELEAIEDESAPPFPAGQAASGGVSILKAQSLCPFQAFARYRLAADEPEDACFGMDARDRGGYLHKALELVWKSIETSDRLNALTEDELHEVVLCAVKEAVSEDDRDAFHQQVSATERQRLNDVVLEWLRLEKRRKLAFRVEHMEEKRTVELAGLQLNVRVDRIDRLSDGSVVLIDYKSGQPAAKHLLGERPREPQLLVYAAAMEEEVDGVFLAQVRGRETKALGMAAREHFPNDRKQKNAPDWLVERDSVHARLTALAAEFLSGTAAVSPQQQACDYCGVKLLCRVAEAGSGLDESDGDE